MAKSYSTLREKYVGQPFNDLTVREYLPGRWRGDNARFVCVCSCGNEVVRLAMNVISGRTSSCGHRQVENGYARGAANTTHGMTASREFKSWTCMQTRCADLTNSYYGGIGIKIAPEWLGPNGFSQFLQDVGFCPSPQHTLDRHPNPAGHYKPGNVRWATKREQAQNRRTNKILIIPDGRAYCVAEWSRQIGIPSSTIYNRLRRGKSAEQALGLV